MVKLKVGGDERVGVMNDWSVMERKEAVGTGYTSEFAKYTAITLVRER